MHQLAYIHELSYHYQVNIKSEHSTNRSRRSLGHYEEIEDKAAAAENRWIQHCSLSTKPTKNIYNHTLKSKVVPYSITSIGLGADPGFLAVSPQVT